MTLLQYTESLEQSAKQEAYMLAHNGKRLTTRITNHVQEKLKMAADLVGGTINQFVVCVFHATWTLSPRQTGQSERSDAGCVFYS